MTTLSPLLYTLAKASSPQLVLALRPQDPLPDWITHVIHVGADCQVVYQGEKELLGTETIRGKRKTHESIGMSFYASMTP